jgi:hypothetical protein
MTLMPITPGLPLTLTQAVRWVLFTSKNDDSNGILARQTGFRRVIVRSQKRQP